MIAYILNSCLNRFVFAPYPKTAANLISIGFAFSYLGGCTTASMVAQKEQRLALTNPAASQTLYKNGNWLAPGTEGDAAQFETGDRYAVQGVFVKEVVESATRIVDLSGQFIIPPLADGHNHWIEGPWSDDTMLELLSQGVFYYKNPSSPISSTNRYRDRYKTPDTIDVSFSLAAISVDESHPEPLYRRLARMYGLDPEELDGEAVHNIPDLETLEARWPDILKSNPDFIKLIFLDILNEASDSPDTLSVEVAGRVIELAHDSGLTVSVHPVTAGDFRIAAELGADEAVHLPGWGWFYDLGKESYRITDEDARLAAENGMSLVTTAALAAGTSKPWRDPDAQPTDIQRLQTENLKTLRRAGVNIAIGVDTQEPIIDEVDYLRWLDYSSDAEILANWVRTGPDNVFPARAIGRLEAGFEASFIALPCDPFEDFDCVRKPTYLEKQGQALNLESGNPLPTTP